MIRRAALSVAIAAGLTLSGAPGAVAEAADRHPITCQGHGTDPHAKIRYRAEVTINAPLSAIWRLQTDVEGWPNWQAAVLTNERLDRGPLRPGSAFRWTTPVPETPISPATTLTVTSTVKHVQSRQCLRWRGPAVGEGLRIDEGVHVWTFTRVGDGVRVRTEETWTGSQVESDVALATGALGQGIDLWLADLKRTAEAA
jgi:uncharacterized membrane protein